MTYPSDFGEGKDYTSGSDATRFNGLPGHPEIWKDTTTGEIYVVYEVPGTDPPIPIMFTVPTKDDLQSFFGDGKDIVFDRKFSTDQILSVGGIVFGSSNTIPEKDGDAWAGFMERMERAMEVQPWLQDPEVFAIFAGAWLEGRPVEEWELQTTDWWQSHNAAERQWMLLNASDPSTAAQVAQDNSLAVAQQAQTLGVHMSQGTIDWVANQLTTGHWSQAFLNEQLMSLAAGSTLDTEFQSYLEETGEVVDPSQLAENQVRDLYEEWLGPTRIPRPELLTRWADKWRRAPEATRDELTNKLRQQRLALLPEYEDETLSYQDIAANWRGTVARAWGELPDESDPFFLKVLRANDSQVAENLLRREGIKRGNNQVMNDLQDALTQVTGGNVIGTVQ